MKNLTLFLLGTLHLSNPSFAQKSQTPTSFVLFFQKVSELPKEDSQHYILELRRKLINSKDVKLEEHLYSTQESQYCQKLNKPSCRQALYGKDLCIPPKKVASDYCEKISQPLRQNLFRDPLFDRLTWNKWALSINQLCNQKLTVVCQKLSKFHDKFDEKHRRHQIELKKSLAQ